MQIGTRSLSTSIPLVAHTTSSMIDPFQRAVTCLRVSVTVQCDFRCTYCMAENMNFLPKKDLLKLDELIKLCSAFIAKGVRKLRLTGGEPLVRKNIMHLVRELGKQIGSGLDELTLTTNGSQLPAMPTNSMIAAFVATMCRWIRSIPTSSVKSPAGATIPLRAVPS